MKTYLSLFFFVFLYASILCKTSNLLSEHRDILQKPLNFHTILSVAKIPSAITKLCSDSEGRLANPNKSWTPTDVILDDKLPRKRLIWAANFESYYVVHYESGGRGHSFHILFAELDSTQSATVIWHAVGSHYKNYNYFLEALNQDKLDDYK